VPSRFECNVHRFTAAAAEHHLRHPGGCGGKECFSA
jgi:hypothetical protein